MKRRTFLKLAALGVSSLSGANLAFGYEAPEQVMTVLGPVPASRLGQTLMHEHILIDFIGADRLTPGRYDPEDAFQKELQYLQKLKSVGGDTLVDCTPEHLGRNVELLRRLSKASGVNIIASTGIYGARDAKYIPRYAYQETAEQLAVRWVREFEAGIPPAGIRPGIIKIAYAGEQKLSAIAAKLVAAAARTHRRTGMLIDAHTDSGLAVFPQLDVLKTEGVEPSAFVWVHANEETNTSLHLRAAELGAWVEFDAIAPNSVAEHVDLVLGMKRAGFLHRVLISQDAGWYHVGEPGGGKYGGCYEDDGAVQCVRGYDFLFTGFIPALRKAGASASDIHTLLVSNPRQALTLRPHDVAR
jgi:phosphotriesterase-related protein